MRRVGSIVLVGFLAAIVPACRDSEPRLDTEEFHRLANAVCADYRGRSVGVAPGPNATSLQVADGLDAVADLSQQSADALEELRPPVDDEADFEAFLAATRETAQELIRTAEAIRSGNQAAANAATESAVARGEDADRLAGDLGLETCRTTEE